MKRPFYVHTPRNYLGESLVGPSIHQMSHVIRNVFDSPIKDYDSCKNRKTLDAHCKKMNDQHEAEMAAIDI